MMVVDSSVWIALLRRHDTPPVRQLKAVRNPREIIVGDVVLLEVLRGARDDRHAAQIERELRQFTIERMLDVSISIRAAGIYRHLRQRGVTIRKTVDLIIATFCLDRGYSLLHADRDFDPLARYMGLQVA
jgi:predicted nucleic acid-binding protein